MDEPSLGTKKTILVLIVVGGCLGVLWPKIFYPMMFGHAPKNPVKDIRGSNGCCDVVLDQDTFANVSNINPKDGFRKNLNLITGEHSLRQERPPHFRASDIHPAMYERGSAIPSVKVIEKKINVKQTRTRVEDGRPGPIPGMRPPMGVGAVHHQASQNVGIMGYLMPLYTIIIIGFLGYTIFKLLFKQQDNPPPYRQRMKPDPKFKKEVFVPSNEPKISNSIKNGNLGNSERDTSKCFFGAINNFLNTTNDAAVKNSGNYDKMSDADLTSKIRETEQLLEIRVLKEKLKETEIAMGKIIANMATIPQNQDTIFEPENKLVTINGSLQSMDNIQSNGDLKIKHNDITSDQNEYQLVNKTQGKIGDAPNDKTVKVVGLELTASCEGGQKWSRPTSPISSSTSHQHTSNDEEKELLPQSIFLEGALPHDSQILVSDSETITEKLESKYNDDIEPAVVLSSKMTLSLINLDPLNNDGEGGTDNAIATNISDAEIIPSDDDEDLLDENGIDILDDDEV